jgi:hypothetical protein
MRLSSDRTHDIRPRGARTHAESNADGGDGHEAVDKLPQHPPLLYPEDEFLR